MEGLPPLDYSPIETHRGFSLRRRALPLGRVSNSRINLRAVAVPVLIGALTAALILVVANTVDFPFRENRENRENGTETTDRSDCSYWGLSADDPRAQPDPLPESSSPADGVYLTESYTSHDVSSEYHLFADGIDYSRPVGLVVRLHGDGAYEFHNPEGLTRCLAEVAASHNAVLLSALAPTHDHRWWLDMDRTQPWLLSLIDAAQANHGIDADSVWWMGYSGGAEFLTYSLAPTQPERITAGAIMVGGGGAPSFDYPLDPPDPDVPLIWSVGTDDDGSTDEAPFDALAAAEAGSDYYRDAGFTGTELSLVDDVGHFLMPQATILDEALSGPE